MSAHANVLDEPVSVALIGRKDEARTQLQTALVEFGASVVFEGEPLDVDLASLQRIAPGVVIVNLDAAIEDELDRLQPVLDDPRVNVVFNEAEVTRQLGGWDLARWARHLAAKVLGHGDTNPPPPPNSEALPSMQFMPRPGLPPTPEQMAGERMIEEFTVEADDHADAIPTDYLPMEVLQPPGSGVDVSALEIDMDAIEGAMTLADARPERAPTAVPDALEQADADAPIDFGFDQSVLDAALSAPIVAVDREAPQPDAPADYVADFDIEAALQPADGSVIGADGAGAGAHGDDAAGRKPDDAASHAHAPAASAAAEHATLATGASSPDRPGSEAPAVQPPVADDAAIDAMRFDTTDFDATDLDPADQDSIVLASADPQGPPLSEVEGFDAVSFDPASFDSELLGSDLHEGISADAGARDAATDSGGGADTAAADAVLEEFSFNLDLLAEDASEGDAGLSTGFAQFAQDEASFEVDEDIERLAAQLDQLDGSQPRAAPSANGLDNDLASDLAGAASGPEGIALEASSEEDDDLQGSAALASASGQEDAAAPAPVAQQRPSFDFSALELAPLDDAPMPVAHLVGAAPPVFDSGAMDLSLEPMGAGQEEEDTSADAIQRIIVLGASIGGPDALRTFLSAIPHDFPALFVLAQHLDNGFFERLAQQLQKSSKVPVRVPRSGDIAAHGEVLVVPSDVRMSIEPDGSIATEPHGEAPHYRPCIDDVLRDVADRFRGRATAIVFSGMAGDAIEGSVYLTTMGGEVWAQTPESCVVSSMVDGARARGVVEFVGTPRELADHCVERYGQ